MIHFAKDNMNYDGVAVVAVAVVVVVVVVAAVVIYVIGNYLKVMVPVEGFVKKINGEIVDSEVGSLNDLSAFEYWMDCCLALLKWYLLN